MSKITITFFFFAVSMLLYSGCGKTNPLSGNVYFHDADSLSYIAGFDNDTLYYIIRGPKLNQSHKTKYTVKKEDDSTYMIEVEKKPIFWEKNTWKVVVGKEKEKGFHSAESRNYYQYSPDKNILR